ncbi:hypothetical protein ABEB36_010168 [Hypothenemus hampei]|uniref:Uncharacterized protein n=1 Tax=Hypothenemus hampei TaxID=57062 RepID=A0ABD1EIR3_HYPHA
MGIIKDSQANRNVSTFTDQSLQRNMINQSSEKRNMYQNSQDILFNTMNLANSDPDNSEIFHGLTLIDALPSPLEKKFSERIGTNNEFLIMAPEKEDYQVNRKEPNYLDEKFNTTKYDKKKSDYSKQQLELNKNIKIKNDYRKVLCPVCAKSKPTQSNSERQPCCPNTCDKLAGLFETKKRKSSSNTKLYSIDELTNSTDQFLINLRNYCTARRCELLARICDIYEPLVNFDLPGVAESLGDPQYQHLAVNVSTETSSHALIESLASLIMENLVPMVDKSQEALLDTIEMENQDVVLTVEVHPDVQKNENVDRRRSTVSWHMPDKPNSRSEDEVVHKATVDADNFRTIDLSMRHDSVFAEIVKNSMVPSTEPETIKQSSSAIKSEIYTAHPDSSNHNKKCCSWLKRKFKRKKKNVLEKNDSLATWEIMPEFSERRKTNIVNPVAEKDQEINNMLHKMY